MSSFAGSIRSWGIGTFQRLAPNLFRDVFTRYRGGAQPEFKLFPYVCAKSAASVDVGASTGVFVLHMHKYSGKCYAFEPRPDAVELIRQRTRGIHPAVTIEQAAVSDHAGEMEMRVCVNDLGRSTIEADNHIENESDVERITVPVRTLDGYPFKERIAFIKIDVEGHEESVIRGALNLLRKDKPALLIEIEERHKHGSIGTINAILEGLGYRGYYLHHTTLCDIGSFDIGRHQNIANLKDKAEYINDFVFIHPEVHTLPATFA